MTDHTRLREFFHRRMNTPPGHSNKCSYLAELGRDMVAWANTIDTSGIPLNMEDAVVKAAAVMILRCESDEMDPGWEILTFPPEQTTHEGSGFWRLCWESGPFEWACGNDVLPERLRRGNGWYTEPHFSFDLCYTEK